MRLAREARGISLREISEQTRISIRYLEAIETDDYKRLPGGIFNRSFVKAYARYVGFDEKEAVDAYVRTAREQGEAPDEVSTTPYQSHVYTDGGGTRSPLVTLLLTILILSVLVLGVYAGRHWWQRRQSAVTPQPQTPTQPAQAPNVAQRTQTPTNTSAFNIQIKAKGTKVWVRTKADDADSTEKILNAEETRDFTPQQRLSIQLSKTNVDALEITINGRPAKIPPETKSSSNLAEIIINRSDYERYLQ